MTNITGVPIFGTDGSDYITAESSVSFQWVPAPGNAYSGYSAWPAWDTGSWMSSTATGPSSASGYVTFTGVTSSEPFQGFPVSLTFRFTEGYVVDWSEPDFPISWTAGWTYDPATGVLDPHYWGTTWDNWIGRVLRRQRDRL